MKKTTGIALLTVVMGGCATLPNETGSSDEVAQAEANIVRGSPSSRHQVVFVHGRTYGGGAVRCTGSYYAPRVVVTSAACLVSTLEDVYVYHGSNYTADVAMLPNIAAPGQTSEWAKADSWEAHPAYDATLHDAEIGVVYLDRKLPFDPLPLARFKVDSSYKTAEIVGWGASKALSADITETEGMGVERSAIVPILGTPTAADYHADDPNPGMLDATVRSHYLKLDGRQYAVDGTTLLNYGNACTGDGGGPIIINKYGQDYIAGVGLWTGLWCEDYQIQTRIDPYLPFFDDAYKKGGQATLIPRLECVSQEPDGSLRAHFGYTNGNGVNVTVAYGTRNYFPFDTKNARPSLFLHGEHAWSTSINIPAGKQLYWKLSPDNSPTTELRVDNKSKRCAANDRRVACERYCRPMLAVSGCPGDVPRSTQDQCIASCVDFYAFTDDMGCTSLFDSAITCASKVSTSPSNWQCYAGISDPVLADSVCATEWATVNTCLGF